MSKNKTINIKITGVVQGVGFRPFVYNLATRYDLKGWVRNTSAGVDIQIAGDKDSLEEFIKSLRSDTPPLARIDDFKIGDSDHDDFQSFEILHSEPIPGAFIPISPDVSICNDCLSEMLNPADQRYLYPFINCTNCGPRFTIIKNIPYDRPQTTMSTFTMCDYCSSEYHNPSNRRFHAQPVACPECGPNVWFEFSRGKQKKYLGQKAIYITQKILSNGKIMAVKGLGGFHLACDATNTAAVSELRRRKLRVDKPFAIMLPDLETVVQHCYLNEVEKELLCSKEKPIVLLRKKTTSNISPDVAPYQNTLGVMLPYTPLHHLLFTKFPFEVPKNNRSGTSHKISSALVMTSANLSEEPIAYTNPQARNQLINLADAFLMHNRDIHIRCDDSVFRAYDSKSSHHDCKTKRHRSNIYPVRRARGYAPNPIVLPFTTKQILATGPELKNTFCLTKDKYAFLSHHIGDMENFETLKAFNDSITHYENLFRVVPEIIASDLHPNYLATRYAHQRAEKENIPLYLIQHHHAHIASCMADNHLLGDQPVIGVSFDGTGYGQDNAIWGGEFLVADYHGYQRFAHFEYVPLPGGDAAIKNPYRIALSYLWHHGIDWDKDIGVVSTSCGDDLRMLKSMLENEINTPPCSSVGRLFDAVSALAGVRTEVNYEAQAAIEFEALANLETKDSYPFEILKSSDKENQPTKDFFPLIISTKPLIHSLMDNIQQKMSVPLISGKFHNCLAEITLEICLSARNHFEINKVALSGGVWQNMILLKKTIQNLIDHDFTVYTHSQIPTNDGGIALGQAMIGFHTHQNQISRR